MFRNKFTILLLISALVISQANAANLYKYKDDQGREITGSRVPAEFVKNGYQVLNERGQVIEVVQRTLTAEERAAQSEQLEQQRLLEQAALRQEEEDRMLLRLYRTPEEVVRRRDATIEQLEAQMIVLNSLLEDAEEKLAELEKRVVNNENAGTQIPANLTAQVEDASNEKNRLATQLVRLESEIEEAITTAEKNINRLKELLNLD
jgi:chromosome segregation ATPase